MFIKNVYHNLLFSVLVAALSMVQSFAQSPLVSIKSRPDSSTTVQQKTDPAEENKKIPELPKDPIATDRPDQTETPVLVPVGMFQIETGGVLENDKTDTMKIRKYTYNSTLFKYGVSKNFELRFIAEYLGSSQSSTSENRQSTVNGFNSFMLGTKIFICEEKGILPQTSLLAHLALPYFGHPEFKVKHLAPRFRFAMHHSLSDKASLSYNLGSEWYGTSDATLLYTASFNVEFVKNLSLFVESYGFMTENSTATNTFDGSFAHDHRFDGGFLYRVNDNFQLDISGGVGASKISPDSFLSAGASWRFAR